LLIATVKDGAEEYPVLVQPGKGVLRPQQLDSSFHGDAMALVQLDMLKGLLAQAGSVGDDEFRPAERLSFTAPYRSPRKIWGIGLNYRDHAGDLAEEVPDEPASFMKGDHTIIGDGDEIVLPSQSSRVTAEAELGLIIGREARNVSEAEALDYVWGVCPILDQTAEDILRRNPRFLTRSKNFPTFFSFGPMLVPLSEACRSHGSLQGLSVTTIRNNTETRTNTVANMTHSPQSLVSFHSQVMPLFPGDIISTGTPGALVIEDGDVVECRIPGVGHLTNPVRRGA
jgi:2-keto-4-pentenoate hydratase/2-oxohepta-3-ene-1,7-dioic acid hydratase in catechol pathway